MATTIEMLEQGTITSALTTELNSITTGSMTAAGSEINNIQATSNFNGYTNAKIEVVLAAYTGTPTANSSINVWWLLAADGTDYEDGSSSVTPARSPDVVIPVRAVATGPQRICVQGFIPVGKFKPIAQNGGLGLTLASSGNTLKISPWTTQNV